MPETAGPEISVVIPVHNEEENVSPLRDELSSVLAGLGRPYEILFVNDGSTDRTLERLLELVGSDPHLGVVELDGNFGEAGALSAGFAVAAGRVIVTMDGDLQNNPADVPRLIAEIDKGWDVASGWRQKRKEPLWSRRLPSTVANWIIARISGVGVHDTGCSLKAYRREVVIGRNIPRGFQRFVPAVFGVRGCQVTEVRTEDRARKHGRTHYGLSRTFAVLRDLAAIRFINRDPRFYAWGVSCAGLLGVGLFLAGVLGWMPPIARWILVIGGGVVAAVSVIAVWGILRYNRAQVRKVYRIRAVHRQGTDDAAGP
ncbi:MAG: glycosyltransferase family 2 protein [Planctomycetota bacterium]